MTGDKNPVTKRETTTRKRRKHIVQVAALCFIEQGFHQTSVRDIAGRAGISLGNLYNHFENKTALIGEIATLEAEELGRMQAKLADHKAPQKTLERFLRSYFDYVSQPENAVLAAEIISESMRNPDIAKGYAQNHEALVAGLTGVLLAGRTQQLFAFDEPAREQTNLMLDLVASAAARVAFEPRGAKAKTRKSLIAMLMKTLRPVPGV